MQYMLLIYNDEKRWQQLSEAERGPIIQEYFALTQELKDNGAYVLGAPLQPTSTSTTVRVQDDDQLVTDGPFAETKEQLGGFYLVDVESIDDAIAYAAKIPGARYGSIEVRPVMPVPVQAGAR